MRIRTIATMIAAALLALGAVVGPAQPAAATTTHYYLEYGATYGDGYLTWYNQSVAVRGIFKAVSGCRWIQFDSYSGAYSSWDYVAWQPCFESVRTDATLYNQVAGGPQHVYITISIGSDALRQVHCTRSGCSPQYAV
jgi:hypothetical protein